MGKLSLDNQTTPPTPVAGRGSSFYDSTTKLFALKDDGGVHHGMFSRNASTASQGAGFAADTYLTNSDLLIPSFGIEQKMVARWTVIGAKTGAGTATPVYTFRLGTNRTTADTSLVTLTGVAGTAVIDNGVFTFQAIVRTAGASGVLVVSLACVHTSAAAVGFGSNEIDAVSGSVDLSAAGGKYLGLSINGGASASWTFQGVTAELIG